MKEKKIDAKIFAFALVLGGIFLFMVLRLIYSRTACAWDGTFTNTYLPLLVTVFTGLCFLYFLKQVTKKKEPCSNENHPECQSGEVLLGNFNEESYRELGWSSKRIGLNAYNSCGDKLGNYPNIFPIFVQESEVRASENGEFILKVMASDWENVLSVLDDNNVLISDAILLLHGKTPEKKAKPTEEIVLGVDYNQSVEQMISAGKYDLIDDAVNEENFPLPVGLLGQKKTVSTRLIHYDQGKESSEIISDMEQARQRPANLAELLALGIEQPELQRQFPIVALGSVRSDAYGNETVPYLRGKGSFRMLGTILLKEPWSKNCFFLTVPLDQ